MFLTWPILQLDTASFFFSSFKSLYASESRNKNDPRSLFLEMQLIFTRIVYKLDSTDKLFSLLAEKRRALRE